MPSSSGFEAALAPPRKCPTRNGTWKAESDKMTAPLDSVEHGRVLRGVFSQTSTAFPGVFFLPVPPSWLGSRSKERGDALRSALRSTE